MRNLLIAVLTVSTLVLAAVIVRDAVKIVPIQAATKATPEAQRDPNRLWCKEHSVYEDECLKCHPELKGKSKPNTEASETEPARCKEHGVYEDECFVCHPEIKPSPDDLEPNRLFCKEHEVYEDKCFICHPELKGKKKPKAEERDPKRLWCKEHDVYEDECVKCHPELKDKKKPTTEKHDPDRLWCKEHDIYEDECVKCHPELKDKKKTSSTGTGSLSEVLMCKEHNVPETECGICHTDLLGGLSVGEGLKVRFASDLSTQRAGVEIGRPVQLTGGSTQEMLGQISFNHNQLAMVTPLGAGVVTAVLKDVGEEVVAGEVMATVQSRDLAEASSELTKARAEANLARQTLAREQDLYAKQISARQDLQQAQTAVSVADAAVAESHQHLLSLGLTEKEVTGSRTQPNEQSSLSVRAPFSGTVIERSAVLGIAVQPGEALYSVADLSTMWMQLSIPESQLASLRIGSIIQARFDAYPGVSFEGEITWISPSVDHGTRMLQARAVLKNSQGLLKDGLFGRASLDLASGQTGLSVPSGAVQEVDGKAVVFKKLQDDLFETRLVQTAAAGRDTIAVLAGLLPSDDIVTEGSYIVKSELLKARLGAGCTDD